MFDDLARLIDEEQGLKKLEIVDFEDEYKLQEWPLSQLVSKCPNLESIKLARLFTTSATRAILFDFVVQVSSYSSCL